ncbi:unnamed protein product, partial [Mycena citricolor]
GTTKDRHSAPEAWDQLKLYNSAVLFDVTLLWDSWALGHLIFTMLTGAFPFPSSHTFDCRRDEINWNLLETIVQQPQAVSFVRVFLCVDFEQRLRISDTLSHPWLKAFNARKRPFKKAELPIALAAKF